MFQQYKTLSHEAKKTQQFLKNNMGTFWPKDFWPSSSPDLNPLDYSIWSVVESKLCKKTHSSPKSLKLSITRALPQGSTSSVLANGDLMGPDVN